MHARRIARATRSAGLFLLACLYTGAVIASESSDRAQALFDRGNLRGAVIELKNALQKDPKDAQARLLLGRLHLESGNARRRRRRSVPRWSWVSMSRSAGWIWLRP